MGKVVVTLGLAMIGGIIGNKLKIPAGALIGSMITVGIFNLMEYRLVLPPAYQLIAQSILGATLGLLMTKQLLIDLKRYLVPSLTVVILLSMFGVIVGMIVSKISGIDLQTALFGSVPGGMQEMIILADSYNVNHTAIVVMQTVRRILIVVIYPILVNIVLGILKISAK